MVNILEYSNKRRLQQLKSEIQEWEEKENQKMSCETLPRPPAAQGLCCGTLTWHLPFRSPLGPPSPFQAGGVASMQS